MVCTLVKAAISVQDSKHLVHCNSFNNIGHHQFKAKKHEQDNDCPCDMSALIITEQLSPSLRLAASPRPQNFTYKRSSSGRKSSRDFSPCEGQLPSKRLRVSVLVLLGSLLCISFIFAVCTLDASMRLHAGNQSLQQRRSLMGFHSENREGLHSLGLRIEHMHHASPSLADASDGIEASATQNHEAALRGLGVAFSKGTKSMPNLIIANLEESCDMLDFRMFLRTLYRSGAMAKSDLVLLFPWPSLRQDAVDVLQEEDNSFKKLLKSPAPFTKANNTSTVKANTFKGRDAKTTDKRRLMIMWGENKTSSKNEESHLFNSEYGSVIGFHMNELDPVDGFSEFLDNPSSQLRRWLCYQMLLGLLRFKFRQVMLVDLGGVVIFDDVFSQRKKDFLYLSLEDSTWAEAAAEHSQLPRRGEEKQSSLPRGIQDNDKMVITNSHGDTVPSAPLRHDADQIIHRKGPDVKDHVGLETVLNKKGRRIKMHVDHSKGLPVKRRDQETMDKSTRYGSGDGKGKEDMPLQEKRMARKTRQGKPNAGAGRQEGYGGAKRIMMKMVYGKEVWECLGEAEKQRRVVSSRVILGSMRSAKGLANSMVVEIVRVALQRKSKLSFPDRALLSYLVQKSPHLLGKRISDSLQLKGNLESVVHSLDNSEQTNVFVRAHDGKKYTIVQASSLNVIPKSMQPYPKDQPSMTNLTLSHLIRADICASSADSAAFYDDCSLQQA